MSGTVGDSVLIGDDLFDKELQKEILDSLKDLPNLDYPFHLPFGNSSNVHHESTDFIRKKEVFSGGYSLTSFGNGMHNKNRFKISENLTSKSKRTQRRNNWREKEKVFLEGITIIFFAQRHSLKVGRIPPNDKLANRNVTVAWQKIHLIYDKARRRENELKDDDMPYRSANALRKKWKDSGNKTNALDIFGFDEEGTPDSILKLLKFREEYNKDHILTCSEDKYKKLKQKLF